MRLGLLTSEAARPAPLPPPPEIELAYYPLRVPGFAHNPYDELFVEIAHVDAAERAEEAGCDGILIDSFADYAIERIRHTVSIPVFGAGEAGIAAAAAGGRRYSIVTVWPESLAFLYEERLAACEGGRLCAGVHYFSAERELELLASDSGVQQRMRAHDGGLVEQLAEACRRAVAGDDSEPVLCGCTCMSPIGPLLAERCEFPVIESWRAGQAAAMEGLLGGARPSAVRRSARRGDIRRLVDSWAHGAPPPELDSVDACEVCAVLGEETTAGAAGRSA